MSKNSEIKENEVYEYREDNDAVDYYLIKKVNGELLGIDMNDDTITVSIEEIKSDKDYSLIGTNDDPIVLTTVYG